MPATFNSLFTSSYLFFLIISFAFSVSLFWISHRGNSSGLNPRHNLNLALLTMLAALIGARLAHVVWEAPDYYMNNPSQIFNIGKGGFVYFGGALLAFVVAKIYMSAFKLPWLKYIDIYAIPAAFGTAVGRLGCFFAGCCYGKSCDYFWAIKGLHPTQLYSFVWDLGLTLGLLYLERKRNLKAGVLFFLWVFMHSIGRLVIEQFRDDFRGVIIGLSISSWISLSLILLSGIFLKKNLKLN